MAKWAEPLKETVTEITTVLVNTGLENLINTKIIVNDDQKTVLAVSKESPANKFAYGFDLKIVVNESIFDQLPDNQKKLVIEEALSGVYYDFDNDKLVVSPAKKVHRGFIDKYGWDEFTVLEESIKSLYDSTKNDENLEG